MKNQSKHSPDIKLADRDLGCDVRIRFLSSGPHRVNARYRSLKYLDQKVLACMHRLMVWKLSVSTPNITYSGYYMKIGVAHSAWPYLYFKPLVSLTVQ